MGVSWLDDSAARSQATSSLVKVRNLVARPGASDRAAQHIAAWLSKDRSTRAVAEGIALPITYRGPHELVPEIKQAGQRTSERR